MIVSGTKGCFLRVLLPRDIPNKKPKWNLRADCGAKPFVFLFDETTTSRVKKQYDGYVCYVSSVLEIHHWETTGLPLHQDNPDSGTCYRTSGGRREKRKGRKDNNMAPIFLFNTKLDELNDFLKFTTASGSLHGNGKIWVRYFDTIMASRLPRSSTCFRILHIPRPYISYDQFQKAFTTILNNKDCLTLQDDENNIIAAI